MILPIDRLNDVPPELTAVFDELLVALNSRFRQAQPGKSPRILSATHRNRLQQYPARDQREGTLLIERGDRNAIFERCHGCWTLVAGSLVGTLNPDKRPTDLTAQDAGFVFHAVDSGETYVWNGSAWIGVSGNNLQLAYASGNLVLGATPALIADVPGATITLSRAGRHLITGVFNMLVVGATDAGWFLVGGLSADGVDQTNQALFVAAAAGHGGTVSQQWSYVASTPGKIVKLRGYKGGGTGASQIGITHTSISALWVGPQ